MGERVMAIMARHKGRVNVDGTAEHAWVNDQRGKECRHAVWIRGKELKEWWNRRLF